MDMGTTMAPMDGGTTMNMGGGTTMDMGGGGKKHMMMMMYFHATVEESNVLFNFWQITNVGSMVYSCVIVFLVAFVYEGLKYFRDSLYASSEKSHEPRQKGASNASTEELNRDPDSQSWISAVLNSAHVMQTILHGAMVGFFLFGWRKRSSVEITEHCQ